MDVSTFLKSDEVEVKANLSAYQYNLTQAASNMKIDNYGRAAAYYRNVANCLDYLQGLKNKKELLSNTKSEQVRRHYF